MENNIANTLRSIYEKSYAPDKFFLIAGPCVIEDETMPFEIAEKLKEITQRLSIPLIFKASYKKANRSRIDSFTGIGEQKGLEILNAVRNTFSIPVITDIHSPQEAEFAAKYVDILQIPAFLCRQTDLLLAAAQTGKGINIKKGQFLSAESMQFALEKIHTNYPESPLMLTDRGTMFGYQDMIVDFRNIPIMQSFNVPVVMDVTHSLQQPNQSSGVSGGIPSMIHTIAKAAIAVGTDGIFFETHPKPSEAKSDGANMIPLSELEALLKKLLAIQKANTLNE